MDSTKRVYRTGTGVCFFILAFFDVSMQTMHIPGRLNVGANAISWDDLQVFQMQVSDAHQQDLDLSRLER